LAEQWEGNNRRRTFRDETRKEDETKGNRAKDREWSQSFVLYLRLPVIFCFVLHFLSCATILTAGVTDVSEIVT
jgi:hypothetical protein